MLTPSSPLIDTPNILAQVADCRGQCPPSPQVVQALLDSERAAKHPRPALPIDALLGQWRLRFTAPNKPAYKAKEPVGKGFYWPRLFPGTITFSRATPPAEIASDGPMPAPPPSALPEPEEAQPQALQSDALSIENQLQFGPLALRFSGPAKFFTKQNLLAFDFVQVQLFLGRFCLLKLPIKGQVGTENFAQTPIAKLPFFAFFAATDQYLAARGRGGGLALWAK
ncbi:MAG: hypothetical protein VKI82_00485 [Leptolyngbya sp.]|nr:hypothetical protein [Leptolyngbya sp.]